MFWRLSDSTLTVHRNAPVWANDRMELTLTYTITRQEVSEWYWRTWRRKLWMYHVFFAVVALWTVIAGRGMWPPDLLTIVYGVLTGICVVLFFIVFPQIMFKPSLRTLTVNESGIETTIGGRSRSVRWDQIKNIEVGPELIAIVRTSGNAFLVPRRAFYSEEQRTDFVSAVQTWQGKAGGSLARQK
jgi:hypothetical protein